MDKSLWKAVLRFLFVAVSIIAIFIALYMIIPLIYPFIIGLALAIIFNPFVGLLQKARLPRWLSVTLTLIILLSFITAVIILVVIQINHELARLQQTLPGHLEIIADQIQRFFQEDLGAIYRQIMVFYETLDDDVQVQIQTQIDSFFSSIGDVSQGFFAYLLESLWHFFRSLPLLATGLLISLLATFFISKDWPYWESRVRAIIPNNVQRHSIAVFLDLKNALFGYIRAQLTLISITFCIVLVGFIILQVEYALTISLFIALVDLIPYLGTGLIFIPWIIYLFINQQFGMVIGLSILYGIVLIQRQMMEPKILGDNVGLDPLSTLFSLFVGFQLFGLLGLIIGPVIMVTIGAMYRAGVFTDLWAFIRGTSTK